MPSKKTPPIKVAIIGTGSMAAYHANKFKETRGCKVVAGVDTDPDRLKAFAEANDIPEHGSKGTLGDVGVHILAQ